MNLDNKNMKIGIFTGGTSVRLKNSFTAILRYPSGKDEIIPGYPIAIFTIISIFLGYCMFRIQFNFNISLVIFGSCWKSNKTYMTVSPNFEEIGCVLIYLYPSICPPDCL